MNAGPPDSTGRAGNPQHVGRHAGQVDVGILQLWPLPDLCRSNLLEWVQ